MGKFETIKWKGFVCINLPILAQLKTLHAHAKHDDHLLGRYNPIDTPYACATCIYLYIMHPR